MHGPSRYGGRTRLCRSRFTYRRALTLSHLIDRSPTLNRGVPGRTRRTWRPIASLAGACIFLLGACGGEGNVGVTAVAAPDGGEVWGLTSIGSALVAVGAGGVYSSVDSAVHWTRIGASPTLAPRRREIFNLQSLDSHLYLNARGGVYQSDNGGRDWTTLFSADAQVFVIGQVLYATESGRVMRSRDTGQNWDTVFQDVTLRSFSGSAEVTHDGGPQVYISNGDAALHSRDGGATWERVDGVLRAPEAQPAPVGNRAVHVLVRDTLYALLSDGRLLSSRDLGSTWRTLGGRLLRPKPGAARMFSVRGEVLASDEAIACRIDVDRGVCADSLPLPPTFAFHGTSPLFAATPNGVWVSRIANQWQEASHGIPAQVTAAVHSRQGYIISANDYLLRATDLQHAWHRGPRVPGGASDLLIAGNRVFALSGDTMLACTLTLKRCEPYPISTSIRALPARLQADPKLKVLGGTAHVVDGTFFVGVRFDSLNEVVVLRSDDTVRTWRAHAHVPPPRGVAANQFLSMERIWTSGDQLYVLTLLGIFRGTRHSDAVQQVWSFGPGMTPFSVAHVGNEIIIGTDEGKLIKLRPDGDSLVSDTLNVGSPKQIRSLWAASRYPRAIIATTDDGLYWSDDGGVTLSALTTESGPRLARTTLFEPRGGVLLASGPQGTFRLEEHISRAGRIRQLRGTMWEMAKGLGLKVWLGVCSAVGGLWVLIVALLRHGRYREDSPWAKIPNAFFRLFPGPARWVLFRNFEHATAKVYRTTAEKYYPLPAMDPDENEIPVVDGDALVGALAKHAGSQEPVWLIGAGGAGKSTVLRQTARIVANGQAVPPGWSGYRPIVVVPEDFRNDDVVGAIAGAVSRLGVQVPNGVMRTLLSKGGFLILFDGITEIETDVVPDPARTIVNFVTEHDFADCRFVLSSRSTPRAGAAGVVRIESLSQEYARRHALSVLVPEDQRSSVAAELARLRMEPLSPLLLHMIIENAAGGARHLVTELCEEYVLRLFKLRQGDTPWEAWAHMLMTLAAVSLLERGRCERGLTHNEAISAINGILVDGERLIDVFAEHYGITKVGNANEALEELKGANLLDKSASGWQFRNRRLEEYFAARHLVGVVTHSGTWPSLQPWLTSDEKREEFVDVLILAAELDRERVLKRSQPDDLPHAWRAVFDRPPG